MRLIAVRTGADAGDQAMLDVIDRRKPGGVRLELLDGSVLPRPVREQHRG